MDAQVVEIETLIVQVQSSREMQNELDISHTILVVNPMLETQVEHVCIIRLVECPFSIVHGKAVLLHKLVDRLVGNVSIGGILQVAPLAANNVELEPVPKDSVDIELKVHCLVLCQMEVL